MRENTIGGSLRSQRLEAGKTQRQLAVRSVLRVPSLQRLRASRNAILEVANRRHLSNIRVFGSVARGTAAAGSDIDLLVHPKPNASVFDLAGFMAEIEELLGTPVDVVSDRGSSPALQRIQAEAISL
ncbi:MAG: nucleotidyltransferase family protein [Gulosibacter sp.]|uniref:nucleotidyltransferase family protein n=1 Tax=Gulosibacter sp. TaxID=2817531 RepID=UPI003F8F2A43